jgi:hypothetical protein
VSSSNQLPWQSITQGSIHQRLLRLSQRPTLKRRSRHISRKQKEMQHRRQEKENPGHITIAVIDMANAVREMKHKANTSAIHKKVKIFTAHRQLKAATTKVKFGSCVVIEV